MERRKVLEFCLTVGGKDSGCLVQHSTCSVGLPLGYEAFAGDVAVPTMLGSVLLQVNTRLLPSSKSLEGGSQRKSSWFIGSGEMREWPKDAGCGIEFFWRSLQYLLKYP